jgi:hypothetical protein
MEKTSGDPEGQNAAGDHVTSLSDTGSREQPKKRSLWFLEPLAAVLGIAGFVAAARVLLDRLFLVGPLVVWNQDAPDDLYVNPFSFITVLICSAVFVIGYALVLLGEKKEWKRPTAWAVIMGNRPVPKLMIIPLVAYLLLGALLGPFIPDLNRREVILPHPPSVPMYLLVSEVIIVSGVITLLGCVCWFQSKVAFNYYLDNQELSFPRQTYGAVLCFLFPLFLIAVFLRGV